MEDDPLQQAQTKVQVPIEKPTIPSGLESKMAEAMHQLMLASSESSPIAYVPICGDGSGLGYAQLIRSIRTPSTKKPGAAIRWARGSKNTATDAN